MPCARRPRIIGPMRIAPRLLLLFALAAVLGTVGDQLHVRFGVLSYPHGSPLLFGQALWVPLLFGLAGVLLVLGHAPLLRLGPAGSARGSRFRFAMSLVWFYGAYASTALLAPTPLILAVALVGAWGARVVVAPKPDQMLAGVLYAIVGPLFESALSATGAFHYTRPDLLLVPQWLPALYLHVSIMTREAYLLFFRGEERDEVEPTRAQ
jgi:Protein of unknown function (DUF2878)